jgi:hypothetical protein
MQIFCSGPRHATEKFPEQSFLRYGKSLDESPIKTFHGAIRMFLMKKLKLCFAFYLSGRRTPTGDLYRKNYFL